MKIRWRQHEATLVCIIAIILIARYVWEALRLSPQQIDAQYAAPFINDHRPFNYDTCVLLPQVASILVLLLSYFRINKLIALCLSPAGKKSVFIYLGVFLQAIVIVYIIGPGINFLSFYAYPYSVPNRVLSSVPFSFGFHPQPFRNAMGGFNAAAFWAGAYTIYAVLRETIIGYIKKHATRRDYRIMIFNDATFFALMLFFLPVCYAVFNVVPNSSFYAYYFALTPVLALVFYTNIYVLFPRKGENSFFNWAFLWPLLFRAFTYTLLFSIFLRDNWSFSFLFTCWAAQVLVITPLSWLYFQQAKDRILRLRGMEQALTKSTADLQFLRSQINPHFLFNALNTLYGTALIEGSTRTAEGIQKLGDMMRFMLHENTLDYIGMDKEIEYLKNYISLQKLRSQTSPDIVIADEITERDCNNRIAPMLLIPFVENAFKHGVSLTEKSWIKIKLDCDDQNIIFEVRNSIHATANNDPERGQSGIGLQNVKERLSLLYPGRHQLVYGVQGNEFVASLTVQLD